jgi:rubrerythrin
VISVEAKEKLWWVDFECWAESGNDSAEVTENVLKRLKKGEMPEISNIELQNFEKCEKCGKFKYDIGACPFCKKEKEK